MCLNTINRGVLIDQWRWTRVGSTRARKCTNTEEGTSQYNWIGSNDRTLWSLGPLGEKTLLLNPSLFANGMSSRRFECLDSASTMTTGACKHKGRPFLLGNYKEHVVGWTRGLKYSEVYWLPYLGLNSLNRRSWSWRTFKIDLAFYTKYTAQLHHNPSVEAHRRSWQVIVLWWIENGHRSPPRVQGVARVGAPNGWGPEV